MTSSAHVFFCLSYLTIVFLNGTALFLVIRTLMGAAAHRGYSYTVAGNSVYLNEVLLSIFALVCIGLLFIVAKPVLRRLATVLAVILLLGSLVTTIFCLPKAILLDILSSFGYKDLNRGFAIFSLVILAPWAFVGFEVISLDTVHFKFPLKKSRMVVFSSIVIAALVYMSMTLTSISTVPPPNLSRGLTAIAVRPRFVSALSPCKTGTCADSLAENVWLPEKAFSGVFALQKRRNPFLFSVFSLRVKVMAIITTVREPILVLFFSARTLLSRE